MSESPLVHYSTKGRSFFWLTTPGLKRTHPSHLQHYPKVIQLKKNSSRYSSASKCKAFLSFDSFWGVGSGGCCVHTHALEGRVYRSLSNHLRCSKESLQQQLTGVEGFTAVRFDTKRRVCWVWALHPWCSWLWIDCVTSRSSHQLDWVEEYVFKKPYLSCHEGKLNHSRRQSPWNTESLFTEWTA